MAESPSPCVCSSCLAPWTPRQRCPDRWTTMKSKCFWMFFCLHLPDLCLLFILGHFFTVGEVELLDILVPALFNYLFVLTYIVMSYACMLVNMIFFSLIICLVYWLCILAWVNFMRAGVFECTCVCVLVCFWVPKCKDLLWETAPMAGACHLLARSSSARIITCFELSATWI